MGECVNVQPISAISSYRTCLIAYTSMTEARVNSFLRQELPQGAVAYLYPPASINKKAIQQQFGFDPISFVRFDGLAWESKKS